jgi:uncharacterized protein (DUF58 family)
VSSTADPPGTPSPTLPAAPDTRASGARTAERVLQRIDWQVVRRLDGQLQGDYRTLFHGHGVDLAGLREYQPQDDVRYIDWNVTARMEVPYVRLYHEDREITGWFLVDLSPSVDFGTVREGREKRTAIIDLVTALARVLQRHGNRVGAILYGDGVGGIIPARGGRDQVLRMVSELLDTPRLPRAEATDLTTLLTAAVSTIRRRSLVVIVSDFISRPGWERPLALLARRHEVLAIRVHDPRESTIPDVGPLVMQDAETGEQIWVDTRDRGFRARFETAARERERVLVAAFKHAGVDAHPMSTEDDLVRAVVRMAHKRARRRR